ncbi:uncharacterized protein YndB with AHSA1/START domain [Actinoalloteichus hoggarensis]|uniref:Activator of Hsp90 ATPase homologue 1/2-like C-terminal domain-containing protein n=1 Tax=Actinoalloteichus hoggarensis TaxID=1470176 RepID=A0A221WC92_9PSEU|nr:SRPBCC domain-containing protein [Actinoalloteichus hoggarensis]ASO22897.1 hypothetical protein AHOG_26475 [Actinoalloteichus hoggarensis]MBB5922501.1 uncharacterized protein YndB with AHSA1/START domain [Actinoalloteichus hoggarensis]
MLTASGTTDDGRFRLRFERDLHHPPATVWRALTEVDELRRWFVDMLDYERTVFAATPGAELRFVPRAEYAGLPVGLGVVTEAEPPRLLEYTWGDETLRWELTGDGSGGCRLVFTAVFPYRGDAAPNAAGWHVGLERLVAILDGREYDLSGLTELEADYARLFA